MSSVFIQSHPYALPAEKYRAFVLDLATDFTLELSFPDNEGLTYQTECDSPDYAPPVSPTLSIPSSSSTGSDSSFCASPITPYSMAPEIEMLHGETFKTSRHTESQGSCC